MDMIVKRSRRRHFSCERVTRSANAGHVESHRACDVAREGTRNTVVRNQFLLAKGVLDCELSGCRTDRSSLAYLFARGD
jgi:hypothetical protein